MRRGCRTACAALAVATAVASCGGGSDGQRQGSPRPIFGFNDYSVPAGQSTPARSAALTRRLGGRITRQVLDWQVAEPRRDRYRMGSFDAVYRASLARGVRPLWIVAYAPSWARAPGTRCRSGCFNPPARAADTEWAELVELVARRYPRSAGIEVWNEPNLSVFWPPRPDPARYTQLLRIAHAAVRRASARMPVLSAGLAPVAATTPRRIAQDDFLAAMYEHGARGAMDALGVHAYPTKPGSPSVEEDLRAIRSVRDARGDPHAPLWVTETGATTTGPDKLSRTAQARVLGRTYRALARQRDVRTVLLYTLFDPARPRDDPEAGYGVLDAHGRAKPAACALAREVTGARRCPVR